MSEYLHWGIKASLLAYVSTLEDGKIEVIAPAKAKDLKFDFEYDAAASSEDILQFRGGVLITAYWGTMRIEIRDPQLRVVGDQGELAIRFDLLNGTSKFDVIASGKYDRSTKTCELNLTYTGQMILGQQYQVGQPIDSATIRFS